MTPPPAPLDPGVLEAGPRQYLESLEPEARPRLRALPRERPQPGVGIRAHAVRGPRIIRRRRRAHPARRTQPRCTRVQARRPAARDTDRTRGAELDLSGEGRWILNPGSVGQPRDGDARAAYLLIDEEAERADYRRIQYPFERTQEEIRERGLPEPLAERLAAGL